MLNFFIGFISGILFILVAAYLFLFNVFGKKTPFPAFIDQFQPTKIPQVNFLIAKKINRNFLINFRNFDRFFAPQCTTMAERIGSLVIQWAYYFISCSKNTKTHESFVVGCIKSYNSSLTMWRHVMQPDELFWVFRFETCRLGHSFHCWRIFEWKATKCPRIASFSKTLRLSWIWIIVADLKRRWMWA